MIGLGKLPVISLLLLLSANAFGQTEETSLYDSSGNAVAYIAEDLTIYLWSGKPVAYLYGTTSEIEVYGFNGKHLGWFENGYIRTNEGDGACGEKGVIPLPKFESFKGFKKFKPFKSFRELAPVKPSMSTHWSRIPCQVILGLGADDEE